MAGTPGLGSVDAELSSWRPTILRHLPRNNNQHRWHPTLVYNPTLLSSHPSCCCSPPLRAMRVSSAPLALVGAVLPFVLADIQITSPKAGDAWKGAQTVSVEWKDSGSGPSLDQFTSYNMFLCMGSNADPVRSPHQRHEMPWPVEACSDTLCSNAM